MNKIAATLILLGILLFCIPTVYSMDIVNLQTFDNCDSLTASNGNWGSAVSGESTWTFAVDTNDKMEGAGSLSYSLDSGFSTSTVFISKTSGIIWPNWGSTPYMQVAIKVSSASAMIYLEMSDSNNVYHRYNIENTTVNSWVVNTIDLTQPLDGDLDLSTTSFWTLRFVWTDYSGISGTTLKIDNIQLGASASTPSPTPTPTVTPVPSGNTEPTPESSPSASENNVPTTEPSSENSEPVVSTSNFIRFTGILFVVSGLVVYRKKR